jgi:hypothetical protein
MNVRVYYYQNTQRHFYLQEISFNKIQDILPDENKFFGAIQQILSKSDKPKEKKIAEKLRGGKCSISTSSHYSRQRWNAYSAEVHFYVPVDNLDYFDSEVKSILFKLCDMVLPKDAGFDIQGVEIAPILDDLLVDTSLTSDLEEIQNNAPTNAFQNLPDDIKTKGKEMSEVYIYLYCVENSLRLFVDQVLNEKLGSDYWQTATIPGALKKSVQARKEQEQKCQWISIRGGSDLFYFDFKDLSNFIIANWEQFKE